jgi:ribosomal protein S18 acetylase RimI-like enzyme
LKSKSQTLEASLAAMPIPFGEPRVHDLTCSLLHQLETGTQAFRGDSVSLLEALCVASGAQRLEFWQAIERLAQGLMGHQRTNISLQRSRVLITSNLLQGAVLITPDSIPRVQHLLVDAQSDRAEVRSFLLASALESLRAAGVERVTARVHEDDTELIALFQAFGFTD